LIAGFIKLIFNEPTMFSKTDIEKYFMAEKTFGLVFAIVGIAAVVAALLFYVALKTNFYKGAAIPLLLTGLLFGIAGFAVFKRSDADRLRNVYAFDMNPGELKEKEIPRMHKVMKNFVGLKYGEIVLVLVGISLFVYFRNDDTQLFWKGFGVALSVMALIAWGADSVAEKRADTYLKGLQQWVGAL
jgi:membrane associated rhomboid family serine protease